MGYPDTEACCDALSPEIKDNLVIFCNRNDAGIAAQSYGAESAMGP